MNPLASASVSSRIVPAGYCPPEPNFLPCFTRYFGMLGSCRVGYTCVVIGVILDPGHHGTENTELAERSAVFHPGHRRKVLTNGQVHNVWLHGNDHDFTI